MSEKAIGRLPGTSSVYEIRYDSVIQAADELIAPPEVGEFLAPGFVDVQVNGFAGVDFNDPAVNSDRVLEALSVMASTGVTRCLPTIITGPKERITGALSNMAAIRKKLADGGVAEAAMVEGFHIEGPNISPEDGPRGAHPPEHVRAPDFNEFLEWQEAAQGLIRLITLSPEWPEARAYTRAVTRTGVVVSVGHTKATADEIRAVVSEGATMSTHLGNAAHAVLPKTENYIWEQLAIDELSPSFIVDGIHIPAGFVRAAIRAKGVEHSVLVTDAVMPALCAPGTYHLGAVTVELLPPGDRVVVAGTERLAGSALRMDHAIGNAVRMAGVSLREAISMATVNPARICRIAGRQRGLRPGEKADIVRFAWSENEHKLNVLETIVNGAVVYSRN